MFSSFILCLKREVENVMHSRVILQTHEST